MTHPYTLNITQEQAQEMPMVDLAFLILKSANNTFYYRDLMDEIAKLKGISESEVNEVIAQLYTEINIDGRFACVGGNLWGLKRWYPLDKSEDGVTNPARPRIINDEDDDDLVDESELFEEEQERPSSRKKKADRADLDEDFDRDDDDDDIDDEDEVDDDDIDDEELDEDFEEEDLDDDEEDLEDDDDESA